MQSTRRRVRTAAKFTSGVQFGVDDLDTTEASSGLNVYRNTATLIPHLDRTVFKDFYIDQISMPSKRLVH